MAEELVGDGRPKARYRFAALVATCVGGLIAGLVLWATMWQPVVDVPGASHQLIGYPAYASNLQQPLPDFYTPPDPLPNVQPGTVLKVEPIAEAPPGITAFRVMYMSTKVDGTPVAVTGAFFDRSNPAGPAGRPLLGFSHGTTGLAQMCGVSQAPFTSGMTGNQFWVPEIKPLVDAGYAVMATDYQNMGAPGTPSYLVAQSEAYADLDGVRAAIGQFTDRIDSNNIGLIGHSQGGQAALSAAEYAAPYAPELAIRGVVSQAPGLIVGLPLVVKTLVESTTGSSASFRAEYISFLAESWTKTYPDLIKPQDVLTDQGMATLPKTEELCGPPLRAQFDQSLSTYVRSDIPPAFLRIANEQVPAGQTQIPVLFTQGMKDTSIVPQFTLASFSTMCREGVTADLKVYPDDDHNSLLWTAQTAVVDWLNDRMAGQPAPNACPGRS